MKQKEKVSTKRKSEDTEGQRDKEIVVKREQAFLLVNWSACYAYGQKERLHWTRTPH